MTANRPRPSIPDTIKAIIVGKMLLIDLDTPMHLVCRNEGETIAAYVERMLCLLAERLGCERKDLRLDHNPPLRTRRYNARIKNKAARFSPNANDPNYLIYRSDAEHKIKTNVRGDGAQHPDRVLITKQRRHERGPKPKRRSQFAKSAKKAWPQGRKIQSRGWEKRS